MKRLPIGIVCVLVVFYALMRGPADWISGAGTIATFVLFYEFYETLPYRDTVEKARQRDADKRSARD